MSENESSKKEKSDGGEVKPPLNIIIDTQPPRSGTCVFHNIFYTIGMLLCVNILLITAKY
jgi:hypothetical protein